VSTNAANTARTSKRGTNHPRTLELSDLEADVKAVRLYEYGGPENLKYEEHVPEPMLSPDSVLIETAATSVNPIDWKIRSGAVQKFFPRKLPIILGVDVSGVVRAVGTNILTFKPGDRVLAMTDATYAELVAVEGASLTHAPEGLNMVDAAALPIISLTGDQLVRLSARAKAGQTLLVTGALGSVGRAAVHTARKLGARVIAGVRARQLAEARTLDVAGTVAIDDDAAIAALAPVDAVADTVGGETAGKLFDRVKNGGSFGYTSVFPEGVRQRNTTVTVSQVWARAAPATVREFAEDFRDGKFQLPIGRRLLLSEASEAHAIAQRGNSGKLVLICRDS
jgi:NADPH:quinone reductase-like Zn-dependent oxidoreductase